MKAIEVITLLANKDTKFFNALHNYCEQEDVLGLSVVMKQDYSIVFLVRLHLRQKVVCVLTDKR